jgi:hypothetical protein
MECTVLEENNHHGTQRQNTFDMERYVGGKDIYIFFQNHLWKLLKEGNIHDCHALLQED